MLQRFNKCVLQVCLLLGLKVIFCESSKIARNFSEAGAEEDNDKRIGLNINRGYAYAQGPGGASLSNTGAYSLDVGVLSPDQAYQRLSGNSGSYGNSYSIGPNAPLTYSNSSAGSYGGRTSSGYSGGIGHAGAKSDPYKFGIQIGNGKILLHNLKSTNQTKQAIITRNNSRSDELILQ